VATLAEWPPRQRAPLHRQQLLTYSAGDENGLAARISAQPRFGFCIGGISKFASPTTGEGGELNGERERRRSKPEIKPQCPAAGLSPHSNCHPTEDNSVYPPVGSGAPPVYRPFAATCQLKPSAAPPVYRPVPIETQSKAASLSAPAQWAPSVLKTAGAPQVYRPAGQTGAGAPSANQPQPGVQRQRTPGATIASVPPPNTQRRGADLNIHRHSAHLQRMAHPNMNEPKQLANSASRAQGIAREPSKTGLRNVATAQLMTSANPRSAPKTVSPRAGAVVQCNPFIAINGRLIDAGTWTLRQIQDWLHAGPAGQNLADREEMLRLLAERTATDMTEKHQSWAGEDPVYRFSTGDPNAVESLYFESTLNPGKYGRLRSQHKHQNS